MTIYTGGYFFHGDSVVPSVLWHCWLGIRKVQSWVLVCWWWWCDWSFALVVSPLITTTSSALSFDKIHICDILALTYLSCHGNWLTRWGRRCRHRGSKVACTLGDQLYNAVSTPIDHCIQSDSQCYNRLYVLLHVSNMFDICYRTYNTHKAYTVMQSVLIPVVRLGRCDWLVVAGN